MDNTLSQKQAAEKIKQLYEISQSWKGCFLAGTIHRMAI